MLLRRSVIEVDLSVLRVFHQLYDRNRVVLLEAEVFRLRRKTFVAAILEERGRPAQFGFPLGTWGLHGPRWDCCFVPSGRSCDRVLDLLVFEHVLWEERLEPTQQQLIVLVLLVRTRSGREFEEVAKELVIVHRLWLLLQSEEVELGVPYLEQVLRVESTQAEELVLEVRLLRLEARLFAAVDFNGSPHAQVLRRNDDALVPPQVLVPFGVVSNLVWL